MITPHAYRSWNADNPRGYVRRNQGILPPDEAQARRYDRRAKFTPMRFEPDWHPLLIDGCRDICARRNWRLHHVVVVSSHLHAIVSWRDDDHEASPMKTTWQLVRDTLKRLLGWMLAKHTKVAGRRWFSRGGSRKRARNPDHFEFWMTEYLPNHTRGRRGGSGWCERRGYYGKAFENKT